jgi:hypothetical protein
MCLDHLLPLGSLHRGTVRASVLVDRKHGEVVQQEPDVEYPELRVGSELVRHGDSKASSRACAISRGC